MEKSVFNLEENAAAALSYVLSFISGIIVLVLERDNKFVRFHAMQSVLLGIAMVAVNAAVGVLGKLPVVRIIAGVIGTAVAVGCALLCVVLVFKAWQKEMFKLPVIGDAAERQVGL